MNYDNEVLQKLVEITEKPIKSIYQEGINTIIEFEDGDILPLFGGGATLPSDVKIPTCSFCGREQTKDFPLMAPPDRDEPMICSKCATTAVETFIQHGVEIELDISHFPEAFKEMLLKSIKDED